MKTNTWAELGRVTNYDFAKVRDLVVAGYTEVCQKGYDNFIAQVEVMHTSSDIDKLTITFWVMDSDGTPKPFHRCLHGRADRLQVKKRSALPCRQRWKLSMV